MVFVEVCPSLLVVRVVWGMYCLYGSLSCAVCCLLRIEVLCVDCCLLLGVVYWLMGAGLFHDGYWLSMLVLFVEVRRCLLCVVCCVVFTDCVCRLLLPVVCCVVCALFCIAC